MIFTILMYVSFILALVFWYLGAAKGSLPYIILAIILIGVSGVCSQVSDRYPEINEITSEIVESENENNK